MVLSSNESTLSSNGGIKQGMILRILNHQVLPELVETCRSHGMTDIIMVHEHRGEPDGLVVSHLPYGPTAYFGLFNVVRVRPCNRVGASVGGSASGALSCCPS